MDPIFEQNLHLTRRQFFGHSGLRLGGIALASMLVDKNARDCRRRWNVSIRRCQGFLTTSRVPGG